MLMHAARVAGAASQQLCMQAPVRGRHCKLGLLERGVGVKEVMDYAVHYPEFVCILSPVYPCGQSYLDSTPLFFAKSASFLWQKRT